jgi:hypothetical protein
MVPDSEIFGGGSGGGTGMDESGNILQSADSAYQIAGNQVVLLSRKALPLGAAGPSAMPGPSVITILAAGSMPTFADDGKVDVRGAKGVRITSGPPLPPLGPPTSSESTNGIEAIAGEAQNVTIQRGLLPTDQKVEMTPTGIMVDAGKGADTIKSLTSIKLSVQNLSTISMDPASITIQGAAGQSITVSDHAIVISYGPTSLCVMPDGIKMQSGTSTLALQPDGIYIQNGGSMVNVGQAYVGIVGKQVLIN